MDAKTIDLANYIARDEHTRESIDIDIEASENYGRRRLSESPLHLLRNKESEKK